MSYFTLRGPEVKSPFKILANGEAPNSSKLLRHNMKSGYNNSLVYNFFKSNTNVNDLLIIYIWICLENMRIDVNVELEIYWHITNV